MTASAEGRGWVDRRVWEGLDEEGYLLKTVERGGDAFLLLLGKTDRGALYGAFHLLRLMQTRRPLHSLEIVENPGNRLRMINHWDNLDGSVERGYAGKSLFFGRGGSSAGWIVSGIMPGFWLPPESTPFPSTM